MKNYFRELSNLNNYVFLLQKDNSVVFLGKEK